MADHRRYCMAGVPAGAPRAGQWAGLRSVGTVEATRVVGGEVTTAQRYNASSLALDDDR